MKAGIGEAGWPLFDEWSRQSSKYDAELYLEDLGVAFSREDIREIGLVRSTASRRSAGWIPEPDMILMGSVEKMLKEGKHPAQGLID